MKKPVSAPPIPCPEQTTTPFKVLDSDQSLTLPTTKEKVCPPLPTFSTVVAKQADSGTRTTNTDFDFRCFGSDNYINQMKVNAGDFIDGMTISCKYNTDQTFPWAGGKGGTQTILPSQQGFSKLDISSNEYIYGMQLYDQAGNTLPLQGKVGAKSSTLDCGGGLLSGIVGKYGTDKFGTYITQISKGICIPPKIPDQLI